jgi:hypothetical protein
MCAGRLAFDSPNSPVDYCLFEADINICTYNHRRRNDCYSATTSPLLAVATFASWMIQGRIQVSQYLLSRVLHQVAS